MTDTAQYTFQELWEEAEWRKCAPDTTDPKQLAAGFLYFCENYWHIRHPERGRIKFDLFEAQLETIDSWLTNRYSIVLKARQIGFSTLVATFAHQYGEERYRQGVEDAANTLFRSSGLTRSPHPASKEGE